jgi:predicted amidohydrolase
MRKVKISLAQMKMGADVNANIEKNFEYLKKANALKSNIVCFPELQFMQFFPREPKRKEPFLFAANSSGRLVGKFGAKAKEYGQVQVLNFYEKFKGKYYDSSPVINADGKMLGVSRMVHIVQIKNFYEQDYYSPSNTGFKVYDTKFGKVGVVICYDRHFPESMRMMALLGAEIVFVPSANLKGEPRELFEWEMRIAAYHNNMFIALVNRVGREGNVTFCGESLVVGPLGKTVKKADDKEQLLSVTVDLDMVKEAKKQKPFLSLRQPRHYGKLVSKK